MNKKLLTLMSVVLVGAFVLSACGSPQAAPAQLTI